MIYNYMKKIIENENLKYRNGSVTNEEYNNFVIQTKNKLDVFLASNRITIEQYNELNDLFMFTNEI